MSGKYVMRNERRRRRQKRRSTLLIALLLLLVIGTGATVAYLMTNTEAMQNTFLPGKIVCQVNGDSTITVVEEQSNIPGYIRAAFTVNWVDENGAVYAFPPASDTYSITVGDGWSHGGDSFYYYGTPVAPGNSTTALIASIVEPSAPEGYTLQIEIIAEAIQAERAPHGADWGDAPAN